MPVVAALLLIASDSAERSEVLTTLAEMASAVPFAPYRPKLTVPAALRLLMVASVRAVAVTPVVALWALTSAATSRAVASAPTLTAADPVVPEIVSDWAATLLPPLTLAAAVRAPPTFVFELAWFAPMSVALELPMPKLMVCP